MRQPEEHRGNQNRCFRRPLDDGQITLSVVNIEMVSICREIIPFDGKAFPYIINGMFLLNTSVVGLYILNIFLP